MRTHRAVLLVHTHLQPPPPHTHGDIRCYEYRQNTRTSSSHIITSQHHPTTSSHTIISHHHLTSPYHIIVSQHHSHHYLRRHFGSRVQVHEQHVCGTMASSSEAHPRYEWDDVPDCAPDFANARPWEVDDEPMREDAGSDSDGAFLFVCGGL